MCSVERRPHLNISIKWKLLAVFLLAFLTPLVLFLADAPAWVIVSATLVVTTFVAWYAGHIFGTISELLKLANRLNAYLSLIHI